MYNFGRMHFAIALYLLLISARMKWQEKLE